MNYSEQALSLECRGEQIVGILSLPRQPAATGVVVVVGGPQYRAGSHRQFVLLARTLAGAGFPVLRVDVRGMGDSSGAMRGFEQLDDDIGAAIDALQAHVPAVRRVVLWGLCDGASAALLYLDSKGDARVQGLCLLNPWVRSQASYAQTQVRHYYTRRLMQRAFWAKLLCGRVGLQAWLSFRQALRDRKGSAGSDSARPAATYQQRMARAWAAFGGHILLVLSGNDYTAREFSDTARSDPQWQPAMAHPQLTRHELAEADHTFSTAAWRAEVEQLCLQWLQRTATMQEPTTQARQLA